MKITHEDQIKYHNADNHKGGTLIDKTSGAENGFCMGISYYNTNEYGTPGVHEDQEGFYVVSGSGFALINDQEFEIQEGMSFVVPKGVKHSLKKSPNVDVLKVLWAHGAC